MVLYILISVLVSYIYILGYLLKHLPSVTDLINRIVQILKQDLRQLRISTQDTELIKPVEPWDEG